MQIYIYSSTKSIENSNQKRFKNYKIIYSSYIRLHLQTKTTIQQFLYIIKFVKAGLYSYSTMMGLYIFSKFDNFDYKSQQVKNAKLQSW